MAVEALAGALILAGLAGVVVPVLPGVLLSWSGVLLWALWRQSGTGWAVLGAATAIMVLGSVVKYLVPGRRLRDAGVPWSSLAAGTLLGVVGFFVVPVLGLPLGFLVGVYAAERIRLNHADARSSTVAAIKGVGLSMVIELLTGLLIGVTWVAGLLLG